MPKRVAPTANRNEIAHIVGISLPTLTKYLQRGFPVKQEGRKGVPWLFDIAECVAWIRKQDADRLLKAHGVVQDDAIDLALERARLARAQTEAAELRNAVTRGEQIPREELLPRFTQAIASLKAALQGIASRVRQQVPHLEAAEMELLRSLHDQALNEFADSLLAICPEPDPGGGSEGREADASDHPVGVG